MAVAIPMEAQTRLLRLGSAFGTGALATAAQRVSPATGSVVVLGGGLIGLLAALTMKGAIAEIGEGMANAAAASMGSIVARQVLGMAPASRVLASGGPRASTISLLPAAAGLSSVIPEQRVPVGGYRSI